MHEGSSFESDVLINMILPRSNPLFHVFFPKSYLTFAWNLFILPTNILLIRGRIIRYDEKQNLLIFYHDDEKRTYHVILNEIEEIQPANMHQIQNKNIRSFSAKQIQTVNNMLSKAKKYNDIYQEVQHLISKLTAEELTAILPILYHFIQTRKNIDSK